MKWLLLVLALPFLLAAGALFSNHPPLLEPPGPFARLKLYLTRNVAQTRVDHVQSELRPIHLELPVEEAMAAVIHAMHQLHWTEISQEPGVLRAQVTTRWLGFTDDVEVHLEPVGNGVQVQARSSSRVGQGDFAANTRHILDLFDTLHEARSLPSL